MEKKLIRSVVKVGNGAGVVLPKMWYGGKAKVELIEDPLNIQKGVLEILEKYLWDICGIYLTGSYARGEQNDFSDVDILVITSSINTKISSGKYEIILISKKNLEDLLMKNILPLLPMLRESKTILNGVLIEKYKKTLLTRKNLEWHIGTTKSALEINESAINDYARRNKDCGDEVSYSLILRLREVYIVDCLIKNKKWKNKDFLNLVKEISGSLKAYDGYIRVKRNLKKRADLPVHEAEKIREYILNKVAKQEKWLIKRKK